MRTLLLLLALTLSSLAEMELRTWTSSKGTTLEARFEKMTQQKVILKTESGKKITLPITALSEADQKIAKQFYIQSVGIEIPGISAIPGKISPVIQCEKSQWHYHTYLPKAFHMGRKWPVLFIMSPGGGKNGSPISRYIPSAEAFGCILICSVESSNQFNRSQTAVKAMAKDVYERFPVEEKFAFSSGFSGGGRMAYLLSEMNRNVVGVIPCGAGDGVYLEGGGFRAAKLRAGTYVYSLVGTNCFNRTGTYRAHTRHPKECRIRFFLGTHVWANAPLITEALARVMGEEIKENGNLRDYQDEYLKNLETFITQLEKTAPQEAHYLASFGTQINRLQTAQRLSQKARQLAKNPLTIKAQQAENDITTLCEKFFLTYDYFKGDRKKLPKRSQLANSLAEKHAGTPYEKILQRLGDKS